MSSTRLRVRPKSRSSLTRTHTQRQVSAFAERRSVGVPLTFPGIVGTDYLRVVELVYSPKLKQVVLSWLAHGQVKIEASTDGVPSHAVPARAFRQLETAKWRVRVGHENDNTCCRLRRLEAEFRNGFPLVRVVHTRCRAVEEFDGKLDHPSSDSSLYADGMSGIGGGKQSVRRSFHWIVWALGPVACLEVELVVVHTIKQTLDARHTDMITVQHGVGNAPSSADPVVSCRPSAVPIEER